ncbi:MAG: hypothetical protein ACD_42C00484G0004 [uncultured bacterium]|nr:MAG: hypothetical protein ACD_42C00484G0004 [uncultured bacterium]OGT33179.1 MAG: thiamine diphosphokinase [Gammaproteobacteria bacterium RIFCSPHIGHO2_02_FULL_39_13]OGT49239.1 MAG: thiamine diphosphokinase [Gammaproteobacteria bacterium RIFCSPHIGHO2_12_FULL_39_24]
MNDWLIIADGESLIKSAVQKIAQDKSIIVLDGALSQVLDYKITPLILIGDFDSIDLALLETIKKNKRITVIHDTNQNTTDLEKALNYLCDKQPNSVSICHATGKRLDHTLYNLRLLKRFHHQLNQLKIITALETIYFFSDSIVYLSAQTKEPLALLAFPKATIHSTNLEYELTHVTLEFSVKESISNTILPGNAIINIQGDALLMISHATQLSFVIKR